MSQVISYVCDRSAWVGQLYRSEYGQNLIEYGMLAALISLIAIGAVTAVGGEVNATLWEPTAASF